MSDSDVSKSSVLFVFSVVVFSFAVVLEDSDVFVLWPVFVFEVLFVDSFIFWAELLVEFDVFVWLFCTLFDWFVVLLFSVFDWELPSVTGVAGSITTSCSVWILSCTTLVFSPEKSWDVQTSGIVPLKKYSS